MIKRDDIRELANFHSPEGCAVTFYYQPTTPPNRSHRDETILVKDLVNNALREAEKKGSRHKAARLKGSGASSMCLPSCLRAISS
jgi:hypothetical protein